MDDESERFTPQVENQDDIESLQRAATPEGTTQHSDTEQGQERKTKSIWSPVRRFICGTPKILSFSRSATPDFEPRLPCPFVNSSREPFYCKNSQIGRPEDPDHNSTPGEEELTCSDEEEHEEIIYPNCTPTPTPRKLTPRTPPPQLSGMCEPQRKISCCSGPLKRRLRRARRDICAVKSHGMPNRNPSKRLPKSKQQKKKPPWMANYRVDPGIWCFLKKYRRDNPNQCLEEMLVSSLSEFTATSIVQAITDEMSDDDDYYKSSADDSDGSFRDAASIARSLSTDSLQSIHSINKSGPATSIISRPKEPIARICNESCKLPTSVCSLSTRNKLPVPGQRMRYQTPPPAPKGGRDPFCTSTPERDPCGNTCENQSKKCPPPPACGRINRDDAAFQHFMRIYQCQNPGLTMTQVVEGAQCAWSKLNPKYKRLYGPRVYTPTHLSPTPERCQRRGCSKTPPAQNNCVNECCAPGIGQTLVGVLTKKLVEACKDQMISPEYRRMLRGLIGSEVTVKICDVKKFR